MRRRFAALILLGCLVPACSSAKPQATVSESVAPSASGAETPSVSPVTPEPSAAASETGDNEAVAPTAGGLACGVERWAVKSGEDAEAAKVDLGHVKPATIAELVSIPAPHPEPSGRFALVETTDYEVSATLIEYKREKDRDDHLVLSDGVRTMIVEIPDPPCTAGPFTASINSARAAFEAKYQAGSTLKHVSVPVTVRGVGFFDRIHGQTGVAPNGIELHPVLSISFAGAQPPPAAQPAAGVPAAAVPAAPAPDSPAAGGAPAGEGPFMCVDGTISNALHRQGACSHHGGIA